MQFGQSPVMQYRPRRRWYFSDREKVRTPARNSADATVSPSSKGTGFPSKSNEPIDAVRDGVASQGEPSAAAEGVEPSLLLEPGRVLREIDPVEVLLGTGRLHGAQLAAERELRVRPAAAVRAGNLDGHGSR